MSWDIDEAFPTRCGWVRHRIALACFIILSVVATWILLRRCESPENDLARVVAVGDLKTNGEHWVIFRFDAPKKRAAHIVTVQVTGTDNIPANAYPIDVTGKNSVLSIPDSTVPIYELVRAGSSKLFKVRHAEGGEWRIRLCLMLRLGFGKQYGARIRGCWTSKSLKPWMWNYVERDYRMIDSEIVGTADSGLPRADPPTSPSLITPWSPTDEVFSLRYDAPPSVFYRR